MTYPNRPRLIVRVFALSDLIGVAFIPRPTASLDRLQGFREVRGILQAVKQASIKDSTLIVRRSRLIESFNLDAV